MKPTIAEQIEFAEANAVDASLSLSAHEYFVAILFTLRAVEAAEKELPEESADILWIRKTWRHMDFAPQLFNYIDALRAYAVAQKVRETPEPVAWYSSHSLGTEKAGNLIFYTGGLRGSPDTWESPIKFKDPSWCWLPLYAAPVQKSTLNDARARMTKTPTQRVIDFAEGVQILCELRGFNTPQDYLDAIELCSQLAAELEAAQRALAEERATLTRTVETLGRFMREVTQQCPPALATSICAAAAIRAGEQASSRAEPSQECSGPASPAPDAPRFCPECGYDEDNPDEGDGPIESCLVPDCPMRRKAK